MAHNNTVLGQMLQLLPRHVFEHQVETHAWQGPKPRKLSYWSQLVAMLYAQLSGKKSLRDLVFSLGRHQRKLYHLGLTPAKRSTLAEANEKRPALIFQKTYEKLLARFQAEAGRQPESPAGEDPGCHLRAGLRQSLSLGQFPAQQKRRQTPRPPGLGGRSPGLAGYRRPGP